MRLFVLFFFFVFASITAGNADQTSEGFIGWHQNVGTKNAQEIRKTEEYFYFLNRIVGGTIAPVSAHPYLVGLLIDVNGLQNPSACGGSLLSATRVLTAAHCWYDGRFQARMMTVVLGSAFLFHGGLRTPISAIAVHPLYDSRTFANDIAVLYLPISVSFTHAIRPIALPSGHLLQMELSGYWARAAGYGRYSDVTTPTTNTVARNVILQIMDLKTCRRTYGNAVLDSNICTNGYGGVGICQGDSGGPLTVISGGKDVVIGVSSFVARAGCTLGHPSVFARVSSFVDWIHHHM
ncbi:brachyurin-like [Amyelois transitella]|uniref:brachyurin-like n=1 Tax=Amyelois transitella TaxID=680683 RepID=UPI00067DCF98|nr:brachyurin-like [Amyelois transitella]